MDKEWIAATIAAKDAEIAALREAAQRARRFLGEYVEGKVIDMLDAVLANPAPIADAMLRVIEAAIESVDLNAKTLRLAEAVVELRAARGEAK